MWTRYQTRQMTGVNFRRVCRPSRGHTGECLGVCYFPSSSFTIDTRAQMQIKQHGKTNYCKSRDGDARDPCSSLSTFLCVRPYFPNKTHGLCISYSPGPHLCLAGEHSWGGSPTRYLCAGRGGVPDAAVRQPAVGDKKCTQGTHTHCSQQRRWERLASLRSATPTPQLHQPAPSPLASFVVAPRTLIARDLTCSFPRTR